MCLYDDHVQSVPSPGVYEGIMRHKGTEIMPTQRCLFQEILAHSRPTVFADAFKSKLDLFRLLSYRSSARTIS